MGSSCGSNCDSLSSNPDTIIHGTTAIKWRNAIYNKDVEVIRSILETADGDAYLELGFADGSRAIHKAVDHRDNQLIFLLLDNGADPNASHSQTLETPLHLAVKHNDYNLVTLLMSFYADPNEPDLTGNTPLELAIQSGDSAMIKVLRLDDEGIAKTRRVATLRQESLAQETKDDDSDISFESDTSALFSGEDEPLQMWGAENENQRLLGADGLQRTYTETTVNKALPRGEEPVFVKGTRVKVAKPDRMVSIDMFVGLMSATEEDAASAKSKIHNISAEKKAMIQDFAESAQELLELRQWLYLKKQNSAANSWKKRWVMIKGSYILWAGRETNTEMPSLAGERRKFNTAVSFSQIESIAIKLGTKKNRKFQIQMKDGGRMYTFKAPSQVDRDFWVDNLRRHKEHSDEFVRLLGSLS